MAEKQTEQNDNLFLPPDKWDGYALLDSGGGMKLERFGKYILARPEPSALWRRALAQDEWDKADGVFASFADGEEEGAGGWRFKTKLSVRWEMQWRDISFFVSPTPFRHVGVFPEQASQWEWIFDRISSAKRPVKILNLFGYTGIASLVCAGAGAEVTHIDASPKIIAWARENQKLSGLESAPIRWICDDALKFVRREVRRGAKYDGFIIDPPKFGRGPKGEIWKIYEHLPLLLDECQKMFSNNLLFVNLTAYAIRLTPLTLRYLLQERFGQYGGTIESGDLAIQEHSSNRILSQAVCARWGG